MQQPLNDPAALRIAMLAPGEVFGGAERQILYLLAYLRDAGVQCHLFCFYERDFAERVRALGIPVQVLPAKPVIRWSNARAIAQTLRQHRIDVLHVHGYKAAAHAALARLLQPFHLIKTEHGRLEIPRNGRLSHWKPLLFRFAENVATRWLRGHVVYVTSELQAGCSREHSGLSNSVIPNGIDFAAVGGQLRPKDFPTTTWNAVVVGRLETVKGVEFAIRAFNEPIIPPRGRLWIVGEGPLKSELEALVASLALGDRVSFLGFRRDAVGFVAHADVLLMPSLHEGLPYTLLEAVAARVPVIVSRVGGLAEVLEHERTALLVPPGDVGGLAQAVSRLAADAELGASLAARAYEKLAVRHGIDSMGAAYLKLYSTLAPCASGLPGSRLPR